MMLVEGAGVVRVRSLIVLFGVGFCLVAASCSKVSQHPSINLPHASVTQSEATPDWAPLTPVERGMTAYAVDKYCREYACSKGFTLSLESNRSEDYLFSFSHVKTSSVITRFQVRPSEVKRTDVKPGVGEKLPKPTYKNLDCAAVVQAINKLSETAMLPRDFSLTMDVSPDKYLVFVSEAHGMVGNHASVRMSHDLKEFRISPGY